MKFRRNWVINDLVKSVHKCKLIGGGLFGSHLGYWQKREFDKSNPFMKFGGNRVINDHGRLSTKAN